MESPLAECSSCCPSNSVSSSDPTPSSLPAAVDVEVREEEAPNNETSPKVTSPSYPENSQSLPRTDSKNLKSSIVLTDDKFYVPLRRTADKVLGALTRKDPGPAIVVLDGYPGSGKSSLAKYVALQFLIRPEQGDLDDSPPFSDGIHFLQCGYGADIATKQQELLDLFNVKLPFRDASEAELSTELTEHLKDKDALVIVDDVWEDDLVEKLCIPGRLNYLITTQVPTLFQRSDAQVHRLRIQDVGMDDARKIVANYASFPGGVIPEKLKRLVDATIEATGFHPLALATVSTAIVMEHNNSVAEWENLKGNLFQFLQAKDNVRVESFGDVYPKSVFQSMMFPVRLVEDDEKTLLHTIALFEGPFVLGTIVKLFLWYTRGWDKIPSLGQGRLESLGVARLLLDSRTFSIHCLSQRFILETEMEDKDLNILENSNCLNTDLRSGRDIATLLCALYGASPIKETAMKRMGANVIWSGFDDLARAFRPFISLMWDEGGAVDTQSSISKAATEVFWKFITGRELDDDNISYLLSVSETTVNATCWFLARLAYSLLGSRYELQAQTLPNTLKAVLLLLSSDDAKDIDKEEGCAFIWSLSKMPQNQTPIVQTPGALETLIDLLATDVVASIQETALGALVNVSLTPKFGIFILEIPFALDRLTNLMNKNWKKRCFGATIVLLNLSVDPKVRIRIGKHALVTLVGLLANDVEDSIIEEGAAYAIANLSVDVESRTLIMEVPHALETFVKLLRAEFGDRCRSTLMTVGNLALHRENAVCIADCRGAVEALVGLLVTDVESNIRIKALQVLLRLSVAPENDPLILEIPFALERIVQHLGKDLKEMCEAASRIIGNLAFNQQNSIRILQCADALEALVELLGDDVAEDIQNQAVRALAILCSGEENTTLMSSISNTLEKFVKFLSKDMGESCQAALKVITNLSSQPNNKINSERLLEAVVGLLAENVVESIQEEAARVLTNLSFDVENKPLILEIPHALERIVKLLSMNLKEGRQYFVTTIENLALDPHCGNRICKCPTALEAVVGLLVGVGSMPESAVRILMNLSAPPKSENKILILGIPKALEGLVKLLNKDSKDRCQEATKVIANLVRAPQNAARLCECAGALEALVGLLADDVDDFTQVVVVRLLLDVSVVREQSILIFEIPNALQSLVKLVSKGMGEQCRLATLLIGNLGVEPNLRVLIGQCPGALEALVRLVNDDVEDRMKEAAMRVVTTLTAHNIENKRLVIEIPNVNERLVKLLRKDLKQTCRDAASLLTNLACIRENAVRICECGGALEALVGLLADDVDDQIQEVAAQALRYLSSTLGTRLVEEKFLILEIPSALGRLVKLLSSGQEKTYLAASRTIKNLAVVPKNRVVIGKCAGALEALVGLLANGVPVTNQSIHIQELAMSALKFLSFQVENRILIMGLPDALERIVKFLPKSMDLTCGCEAALVTLGNLAVNRKNAVHIGECSGVLESLVALLDDDVLETLQEYAARALATLTLCPKNANSVSKIPGTLERLISLLSKEPKLLSYRVARVVNHLASLPQNVGLMTSFLGDLESLVQQLVEDGPTLDLRRAFWNVKVGEQVEETIQSLCLFDEHVSKPDVESHLRYQSNDHAKAKSRDYSQALIKVTEYVESSPSEASSWQERGIVRRVMGDLLGALDDLNKANEMEPNDYEVLKHRALVKYMLKDVEGACTDAEKAMQVKHLDVDDNPDYGEWCYGTSSVKFLDYSLK